MVYKVSTFSQVKDLKKLDQLNYSLLGTQYLGFRFEHILLSIM